MNFKPLQDRIIIEKAKAVTKTKSGLYIPDTANSERPKKGTVIAVGPGKKDDDGNLVPVSVEIGDVVMYGKSSGIEAKIEDKECVVLKEEDIIAVINE